MKKFFSFVAAVLWATSMSQAQEVAPELEVLVPVGTSVEYLDTLKFAKSDVDALVAGAVPRVVTVSTHGEVVATGSDWFPDAWKNRETLALSSVVAAPGIYSIVLPAGSLAGYMNEDLRTPIWTNEKMTISVKVLGDEAAQTATAEAAEKIKTQVAKLQAAYDAMAATVTPEVASQFSDQLADLNAQIAAIANAANASIDELTIAADLARYEGQIDSMLAEIEALEVKVEEAKKAAAEVEEEETPAPTILNTLTFDDAESPALTAGNRATLDCSFISPISNTPFLNIWGQNNNNGLTSIPFNNEDLTTYSGWQVEFDWAGESGCNKKEGHTYFYAGETVLFDIVDAANWGATFALKFGDQTVDLACYPANRTYRISANTAIPLSTQNPDGNGAQYWHHFIVKGSADKGVTLTVEQYNAEGGKTTVVKNAVLSSTNVNPTSLAMNPGSCGAVAIDQLTVGIIVEPTKTVLNALSFDNADSPALTAGNRASLNYDFTSPLTNTVFLNIWGQNNNNGLTDVVFNGDDLTGYDAWELDFYWAGESGCNTRVGHTYLYAGETVLFDIVDAANWGNTFALNYGEESVALACFPCNRSYRISANTGIPLSTQTEGAAQYWHHFTLSGSADKGVRLTVEKFDAEGNASVVVKNAVLSAENVSPTRLSLNPGSCGAVALDELVLTVLSSEEVIMAPEITLAGYAMHSPKIDIRTTTPGAEIYYATANLERFDTLADGTINTILAEASAYALYEGTLVLDQPAVVYAYAQKKGKQTGVTESKLFEMAPAITTPSVLIAVEANGSRTVTLTNTVASDALPIRLMVSEGSDYVETTGKVVVPADYIGWISYFAQPEELPASAKGYVYFDARTTYNNTYVGVGEGSNMPVSGVADIEFAADAVTDAANYPTSPIAHTGDVYAHKAIRGAFSEFSLPFAYTNGLNLVTNAKGEALVLGKDFEITKVGEVNTPAIAVVGSAKVINKDNVAACVLAEGASANAGTFMLIHVLNAEKVGAEIIVKSADQIDLAVAANKETAAAQTGKNLRVFSNKQFVSYTMTNNAYVLNAEGTAWVYTETPTLAPFAIALVPNEATLADLGNEILLVADVSAAKTTGIEQIGSDAKAEQIFDLQGRQVFEPVRGQMYIKAGRKVVVK